MRNLRIVKLQSRKTCGARECDGKHDVFQMSIPKHIIDSLGWKKGDSLKMSYSKMFKKLHVKKVTE